VALDGLRHLDEASLSPDERARAARLAAGDVRRRFVASRAALRDILAAYVGASPAGLRFRYGPHGKPALAPPLEWLHFNLAHSQDLAVVAVARRPVGVDVERVRPLADGPLALAARTFAPGEVAALRAAPQSQQLDEFFRYWTCKEAYVKARGAGLSLPFDQFTVELPPHAAPRLLVAPDGDRG
jgi:4'-phosphopantetheinyl transferase